MSTLTRNLNKLAIEIACDVDTMAVEVYGWLEASDDDLNEREDTEEVKANAKLFLESYRDALEAFESATADLKDKMANHLS